MPSAAAEMARETEIEQISIALETHPPAGFEGRWSALGWAHIVRAVLDARDCLHVEVD